MSIRLFVHEELSPGAQIVATPEQSHYLTGVMRRALGDPVCLFNGRDGEWRARLIVSRRDHVTLAVETLLRAQLAEPDIILAFAVLKRNATDLLTRIATELGVATLIPVLTERTNAERVNVARLMAIAREASEQSERLTVPLVCPANRLPELLRGWSETRPLFAALERGSAPWITPTTRPSGLLIGPEGGFTNRELDALVRHPSVAPISLGRRILRAETAAIAGLVLLQAGETG